MATFSEAQITDICKILGLTEDYLTEHLSYYADLITESGKTEILAKITIYEEIERKFNKFRPNNENKGFDSDPEREKADIKRKVANLTYATDLIQGYSSQGVLMRL